MWNGSPHNDPGEPSQGGIHHCGRCKTGRSLVSPTLTYGGRALVRGTCLTSHLRRRQPKQWTGLHPGRRGPTADEQKIVWNMLKMMMLQRRNTDGAEKFIWNMKMKMYRGRTQMGQKTRLEEYRNQEEVRRSQKVWRNDLQGAVCEERRQKTEDVLCEERRQKMCCPDITRKSMMKDQPTTAAELPPSPIFQIPAGWKT